MNKSITYDYVPTSLGAYENHEKEIISILTAVAASLGVALPSRDGKGIVFCVPVELAKKARISDPGLQIELTRWLNKIPSGYGDVEDVIPLCHLYQRDGHLTTSWVSVDDDHPSAFFGTFGGLRTSSPDAILKDVLRKVWKHSERCWRSEKFAMLILAQCAKNIVVTHWVSKFGSSTMGFHRPAVTVDISDFLVKAETKSRKKS